MNENEPTGQVGEAVARGSPPSSIRGWDLLAAVPILWAADLAIGFGAFELAGGGSSTDFAEPRLFLWTTLASGATTLAVSWLFVCRRHGRSFTDGFAISRVSARLLAVAVLLGLVGGVAGSILFERYGTGESFIAKLSSTPAGLMAIGIAAFLMPPVEEVYYRGFVFPVLRDKLGAIPAVVLASLWFTTAHAFQLAGDWIGLPVILTLGAVLALLRHSSRSLTPSIFAHWTYNVCVMGISFFLSS